MRYKIEIAEKIPCKDNPYRATVWRDTFFADSWFDVSELRYFRDGPDIRCVGIDDIASIETV